MNKTDPDKAATTVGDASVASALIASGDHCVELHDIYVLFPEGKFTSVTGPTASRKTTLLTALLGKLTMLEGRIMIGHGQ